MGYLCAGPRRTGAAPRSPRSPKATGVPSRLQLRGVQLAAAGSRRPRLRSAPGPPPAGAPDSSHARRRGRPAPGGRAAPWGVRTPAPGRRAFQPAHIHQTSTLRPGCPHPKAVPVRVRASLLLARDIHGQFSLLTTPFPFLIFSFNFFFKILGLRTFMACLLWLLIDARWA